MRQAIYLHLRCWKTFFAFLFAYVELYLNKQVDYYQLLLH